MTDEERSLVNRFKTIVESYQKRNRFAPYIYATLSNINLVILQVFMKYLSAYINPLHALAIRGFFLLLLNSIVIHLNNFTLDIKDPTSKFLSIKVYRIILKRIVWSCLTVSMLLAPLKYIPAGTANALFNLAPIIVCFVEAIRYKVLSLKFQKPLNVKHFFLTIISFVGILLIIQPDFLFGQSNESYSQYKYLLLFSLASAFTNSISMTYLHDLQGKISGTIALQYFYLGQCLFNNIAIMFQEQDLEAKTLDINFYFYMTGFIVSAYLLQNFMTRAIMLKKPSFIMPLGYVTIILSAFMDFIVFGSSFSMLSIAGMVLTSSGLLVKLLIPQEEKPKVQITNENKLELEKM